MFEYLLITVLLYGVLLGHEIRETTSYVTLQSKEQCEKLKQGLLDAELENLVSVRCERVHNLKGSK
jgi:hypothetical protein